MATSTPRPLATREQEIVRLIADGQTTPEVARALGIAADTVQGALHSIYLKLGVRNRAQLVRWAFVHGLVKAGRR